MRPLRTLLPLLLLALWAPCIYAQEPPLRIHFVDVGQGDAVLIQSPSGQNVVYDAGEDRSRMREYLAALGVTEVGLVIASHNHADHIGGLAEVLSALRPRFYMDNGIPAATLTHARVLEAVAAARSELLEPTARKIALGDVSLDVVPPPGIAAWDQNDNSIGLVVEYGPFRLSLAGDAEPREWAWWNTHHPEWLTSVQIHKASHHGSINGDTAAGIASLSPEVVVVSAGPGNSYGHPDREALRLYAEHGATVYRTDRNGTVIVEVQRSGAYAVRVERGEGAQPPPATPAPLPAPTPTPTPTPAPTPTPPSPAPRPPQPSCIDINAADVSELQQIIHIGPVRAQEIINLRHVQRFASVNDLIRVNGIGPARLREILAEGKACVR
jgi:beta-lactamase superfamily II metal-dependent hydrolase